jgi:AraC-like DNA-binding protein
VLVIDSATVPRQDRLSFVVESVTGAAHATSFTSRAEGRGVHLSMSVWQFAGVNVFDTECSAHTLRRAGPARSDEEPAFFFTYGLKGVGAHHQPGRQMAVRPSGLWATDASAPYDHHVTDTRTLTARMTHEALGIPMDVVRPTLDRLHLSPLAPLFTHHVREVRRVAGHVNDVTASQLGASTLSLARALVASVAPDSRTSREVLDEALILRVKSFVRQHLGDPRLNAQRIADAHFISMRQLYKVCANSDLRLEQWIIEERLARAAADLSRSSLSRMTVGEIAGRWGFTSAAHFATRFRGTYGVSPREWRAINRASQT